jgi:hypothetical protein
MTFLVRPGAARYQAQLQTRALDAWRCATLLVQLRWDTFLVADRASRPGAFAAYVAALDAEDVAAGELAEAHSDLTAAA